MRLDLHVHSVHSSDGMATPREIVRQAEKYGINGIAITDHNSLQGSMDALAEASGMKNFVVVRGVEVSSLEGHILVYGIDESIPRGFPAAEVVERAIALGGIAVTAHPYRFWSGVGERVAKRLKSHAIEGQNSRSNKRDNLRAKALGAKMGKPLTGGSDGHDVNYVGVGATVVADGLETEDQVIEAIVKGKCSCEGINRPAIGSIRFAGKNLAGWFGRGMKRI